jgi:hypothetical protein
LNGKNIKIDDNIINKSMNKLNLSREEAIQLYLEDEGIIINQEQEALDKTAKQNKAVKLKARKSVKNSPTKRERKPDIQKDGLVERLADFLKDNNCINIQIVKIGKLIEFDLEGNHFKLDLIRTRTKKGE